MKVLLIALFVLGTLFLNAAHIPAWFFGAGKPQHRHWKLYAAVGVGIYVLTFILANTLL